MLRAIKHETLLQMSKYSEIPVINGLTDMSHPCQALADIMTFEENLGSIKGKKIAWIGDGNNVANSWLHASAIFGCELYLACPETRLPSKKAIEWAENNGGNIEITQDPLSAAKNANAIITDTWISMGENFSEDPESIFRKYRVDKKIMNIASIANGLMESVLERRMETIRPENEKSNNFINKQETRIKRTINWLENNWNNYNENYLTKISFLNIL